MQHQYVEFDFHVCRVEAVDFVPGISTLPYWIFGFWRPRAILHRGGRGVGTLGLSKAWCVYWSLCLLLLLLVLSLILLSLCLGIEQFDRKAADTTLQLDGIKGARLPHDPAACRAAHNQEDTPLRSTGFRGFRQ